MLQRVRNRFKTPERDDEGGPLVIPSPLFLGGQHQGPDRVSEWPFRGARNRGCSELSLGRDAARLPAPGLMAMPLIEIVIIGLRGSLVLISSCWVEDPGWTGSKDSLSSRVQLGGMV